MLQQTSILYLINTISASLTQVMPHLLPNAAKKEGEREKRERVCGCLHLTGLPCAGPFHILESIHGTILMVSTLS